MTSVFAGLAGTLRTGMLLLAIAGPQLAQIEPPMLVRPSQERASMEGREATSADVATDLLLRGERRLLLQLTEQGPVEAVARRIERGGGGAVSWTGTLQGQPGSWLILTLRDGVVAGTIHARDAEYRLLPRGEDRYVLERVEHGAEHRCEATSGAATRIPPDVLPEPNADDRTAAGDSYIDLLVLYTESAMQFAGGTRGVRAILQNHVDAAKMAFRDSDIPARLRVVGVQPARVTDSPGSPLDPLTRSAEVRAMRDALGADLVALAHNGAERCGRAHVLTDLDDATGPEGFSTAAISCGARVFVHEIGHNLGFQHDPEWGGTDEPAVAGDAYGHWASATSPERPGFRTIMVNSGCACEDLLQFSSPLRQFDGRPIGIEGERDNSRVSRITAPFVAAYRDSRFLFSDDFQSGDLDAWKRARGPLAVAPATEDEPEALALAVPLDGTGRPAWAMHRVTGDPAALDVDLVVDLSQGELPDEPLEIVRARRGKRAVFSLRVIGGRRPLVRLYASDGAGNTIEVGSARLSSRLPSRIGIRWRRATDAASADGSVALFSNGSLAGEHDGLRNRGDRVAQMLLGLPLGHDGTPGSGTLRIDDYSVFLPPPADERGRFRARLPTP